ncbi:MAG: hypothetical protein KIT25_24920 [Enhydrobacter sp.]|nr:MAG: hypothetical protein KIT25_24920 [Enhydrobacter sp.]
MCLQLEYAEAQLWKRRARTIISDAKAAAAAIPCDPLLKRAQRLSTLVSEIDSIKKRHGRLIEDALLFAINKLPDWTATKERIPVATGTPLQRRVVRTLRHFRSTSSYVGGGAALNQRWPRLSDDMDIFSDRASLPNAAMLELKALEDAGFTVRVTTRDEWMVEAIVREYGFETRIQWMHEEETSRRFFPALYDEELGFRLHPADAAVNKVLCAARRHSAARDAVDLVSIVRRYTTLGPLIWALAGKDPKLNPQRAISDIRRIAFGYSDEEIRTVRMGDDPGMNRQEVRDVLDRALIAAGVHKAIPITDFGRMPRFEGDPPQ